MKTICGKSLLIFFIWGAVVASIATPTRVTPINVGEAVFAPFWDSLLKESLNWKITAGKLEYSWCMAKFKWLKSELKPGKPAFAMERDNNPVDCRGYDQLISSICIPKGAKLKFILETDAGLREKEWFGVSDCRDEYIMELNGAACIKKITMQVFDAKGNSVTHGFVLWMGLRNKENLKTFLAKIKQLADQPLDIFMAPEGTVPTFEPRIDLLGGSAKLKRIQDEYLALKKNIGKDFVTEDIQGYEPEKLLRETLPYANVRLLGRVKDNNFKFKSVYNMVQKALITRNADLMRMVVRNVLVIALTPNWDSTFLSDFTDSGWDQRVFSNFVAAEAVALVLDYAGDLLSPAGRELLEKRLALDGLGQINYNVWRYEYIFGCNQFAVFSRGRIAAYLALEVAPGWNGKRIRPYTELAMKELRDSINSLLQADGSFLEGAAYFSYTIGNVQPTFDMYSNVRGIKIKDIVPAKMKKLGAFADTLISTDRRGGLVPFSSSQGAGRYIRITTCQLLAMIAPESQWRTLYHDSLGRYAAANGNSFIPNIAFLSNRDRIPEGNPEVKPVSELPIMGIMSSTRFLKGSPVKIFMFGAKAKSYVHRHNDKGSFVLEFDGDTYAADPGGQRYADADAKNVLRADYHNTLVPLVPRENETEVVSSADIRPVGKGDEKSFHASFSPASAYEEDFTLWKRTIDSLSPETITITDEYKMTPQHKGVRFVWITELPWKKVNKNTVRLDGRNSYALIEFPDDLIFSAETLTVRQKSKYTRLNFLKKAAAGKIVIKVRLFKQ